VELEGKGEEMPVHHKIYLFLLLEMSLSSRPSGTRGTFFEMLKRLSFFGMVLTVRQIMTIDPV